ncbi:tetrapyrrole methyltransferase [Brachybacterium huguangmaarense]|uniref:Tetrapyrrole methyltransferase n=1 Tax=Brachybacterium huguangmaarense TaxID=1652028 RepID=A0ABY6G045_9MICO|nr:MazG nucleotide pyrophosphohydrolase domain-containing protein [Brachybacterium huguangmaarense]UYG16574.1 tetrapyrrole methyltransferase [Brachybacterium huguangmaarense]
MSTEPAGTPAPRGSELLRSVEIVDALRGEGGDAWSAQQTHESLARYLLEETYEVLEAIEQGDGDPRALVDELGDLWFQILFHARLGEEESAPWSVDDVARAFNEKMERRNPHVFGDDAASALAHRDDVDEIVAQWHAVKAAEGAPQGILEGLPERLPALQSAAKAVHRARTRGELEALLAGADEAAPEVVGGDVARALLDLVVEAESRDEDPESALRTLLGRLAADGGHGGPGASAAH